MFVEHMRTSTVIVIVLFVALGLLRDRRYWLAGLPGSSAGKHVRDHDERIVDYGHHARVWWAPVVVFGVELLGFAFIAVAGFRFGIRPSWSIMALSGACWAVWLGTGFHINGYQMIAFDPLAEAMNETAKTLWAAAYLWPLWRQTRWSYAALATDAGQVSGADDGANAVPFRLQGASVAGPE
jgi:hypothetical protein